LEDDMRKDWSEINGVAEKHDVFNHETFLERFLADLRAARGRVIIQSPFATVRRTTLLLPEIRACSQRGIHSTFILQKPVDSKSMPELAPAAELLLSAGAHVSLREQIHEKLAIIDEDIFWDGSLNICSHSRSFERMTRWISRRKVAEAGAAHKLNLCDGCAPSMVSKGSSYELQQRRLFADAIVRRRKLLGLSQGELAERSGISQSLLCRLESGKRDCLLSTIAHIYEQLGLEFRTAPRYLLGPIDQLLGQ
jgi:DNA-binding XRE family transcriptional regulator